jgi:hypothetical protein
MEDRMTEHPVARSYKLLSLLEVCHLAAMEITDGPKEDALRNANYLADVIAIARGVATEVHDALERAMTI